MSEETKTAKNPLSRKYTLWYSGISENKEEDFKDQIKPLATIESVEDFWAVYQHLLRPDKLQARTCYHLF